MGLFDIFKKKESEPKETITMSAVSTADDVIPIEKRIKGTNPTCDSLYPHEVLVLSYAESCTTSQTEFARFWWYKYGIKDVQAILKKLQSAGFVEVGSVSDALALQKLPALKYVLQEHGVKVSGKKAEIIQRILENVPVQELEMSFPEKPYKITELGETALNKFDWIIYIHRHDIDGLDIWNLTQLVQTPPYTKYRDKIWGHLNQLGGEYAKQNEWGLYRNTRFQMSEFVMEENKPQIAFSLLCEVSSFDLSGVGNSFRPEFIAQQYEFFYPYENSIVKMAPGIMDRIEKLSDGFGWSTEQLYVELKKAFEKFSVQYSVFTDEEKAQIVIAEIEQDEQRLVAIYESSRKRFKKQYRIK